MGALRSQIFSAMQVVAQITHTLGVVAGLSVGAAGDRSAFLPGPYVVGLW